jgi:cobalt-zinc-cadmium efflux system protein
MEGHLHIKAEGHHRTLMIVLGLTLAYLIVEIVVGLLTNSLALVADAIHMVTDAGALALAAFASWMAGKPATPQKTYGYYRVEILAALANGLLLVGSAGFIIYEAIRRLNAPQQVLGGPMLIVAVVGLIVNLVAVGLLHGRAGENLNVKGAFYEVVKDALGSVGVIIAGVVILTTDFTLIDPIVSILIALFILPRTWNLLTEAVDILLESTPPDVDLDAVRAAMGGVRGVESIHDLHVWTITPEFLTMSGHVVVEKGVDRTRAQRILEELNDRLAGDFGIEHATFQIEYADMNCAEEYP